MIYWFTMYTTTSQTCKKPKFSKVFAFRYFRALYHVLTKMKLSWFTKCMQIALIGAIWPKLGCNLYLKNLVKLKLLQYLLCNNYFSVVDTLDLCKLRTVDTSRLTDFSNSDILHVYSLQLKLICTMHQIIWTSVVI